METQGILNQVFDESQQALRLVSVPAGGLRGGFLGLAGGAADYAVTPHRTSHDILGDIEIEVWAAADDWTPPDAQNFLHNHDAGTLSGYALELSAVGNAVLRWGDGVAQRAQTVTPPLPFTAGAYGGVRFRRVVSTGVGTVDVSTDAGQTWTAHGTSTVHVGVGITAGTIDLHVGRNRAAIASFAGRFGYATVRDGIGGTAVANPDFRNLPDGTTSFTDGAGNVWTVNGGAYVASEGSTAEMQSIWQRTFDSSSSSLRIVRV